MEDVKFDDTPVGLWNFGDAENNLVGENARYIIIIVIIIIIIINILGA